ncbi:two-component system, OmpR family, sensor kinase [Amycolatopsis xylanica]|uniref:histidine kinase n=1 Tax=Amycolatopsis xylanica TaxID=589385 RepID=A0A1H2ZFM2_9PSEU|nr:HAMP domain-containing sensor histidine kinase [Amycolatopsis xylanica]SDX16127.1 two-component system, OmpR family, sensor kinase [Amycolatopsis xylanica]
MSSSPRAKRPWSLRRRLIVQLAALLTLVCLVVGVVTEFALRDFLIGQLDQRLSAASDRGFRGPGPGRPSNPSCDRLPGALYAVGQGVDSLFVEVTQKCGVRAAILRSQSDGSPFGQLPHDALPVAEATKLLGLPLDTPRTVDVGKLGGYRVVAKRMPDGGLLVTGLPTKDVSDTLWSLGFIFGGVALGGLVLAGAVGAVTIRRTMQPLDRLAATASRVAELPLDRGEVALSERVDDVDTDPRTEVGKVGSALNRMLGHIANALKARQASESRVRQFVADASHELRTPLAAIRGYAELTRRSKEDVPPDIAFAMSRVESESARMTTLVEDLLLLARLDSGRPVVHEPVDVSRLVADAVADAHVAGPEHKWLLEVPGEPISVLGDSGQLHQVLTNLLANARSHTPAGTTVTTSLSTKDGWVWLKVVDDGPGIPPEVLPDVFERFARGDNSRSRAAGSTGLGLSIVAAVVGAHRGEVKVWSQPGRTEFHVAIPAANPR